MVCRNTSGETQPLLMSLTYFKWNLLSNFQNGFQLVPSIKGWLLEGKAVGQSSNFYNHALIHQGLVGEPSSTSGLLWKTWAHTCMHTLHNVTQLDNCDSPLLLIASVQATNSHFGKLSILWLMGTLIVIIYSFDNNAMDSWRYIRLSR